MLIGLGSCSFIYSYIFRFIYTYMTTLSSLVRDDIRSMRHNKRKQLWLITALIAGLLFVLNVFLWFALYSQEFSSWLRSKLGMYFYIVDTVESDDTVYARVMQLSKRLEDAGMETVFASRDEAFGFLQNRIPNVIENFQRFGINNPLPATLYVMFDTEQQYQILRETIADYRGIISNVSDLDQAANLRQQETRVVTMIKLMRFFVIVSSLLVLFLFVVILALCLYMLHTLYTDFHKKITVKKVLWASYNQIVTPFLIVTGQVLLWSYAIAAWLLVLSGAIVSAYMSYLFDVTIRSILVSYGFSFWLIVIVQILLMVWLSLVFSRMYVEYLVKKTS